MTSSVPTRLTGSAWVRPGELAGYDLNAATRGTLATMGLLPGNDESS